MAVTSLWHIKGSLKDLIIYVENPEKTVSKTDDMNDFYNVFSYVKNPNKTENETFVTSINCLKEIALEQMIEVKKQYGKTDGYIAYHGYQSFKPDEISARRCHEIGVKLANEMWGDKFQIVVTTHLDKGHLHNHFCFNSVSFKDGKKYNYSKSEIQRLRDISDKLCIEYGLSVVKSPNKKTSRVIYLDEKAGKDTRYNVYKDDIREAINGSRNLNLAEKYLNRMGYITDFTGDVYKIRLPQYEHFTNFTSIDSKLTNKNVANYLGSRTQFGNKKAVVTSSPYTPIEIKKSYVRDKTTSHIYNLYLYYCYELGILPKKTNYKPTSPYLKEDLRKIDEISSQVIYMDKFNIKTFDDLYSHREILESEMNDLIAKRTKLQNKIRRASDEDKVIYRLEKAKLTEKITKLRKDLKLNLGIEKRSVTIQNNLDLAYSNEEKNLNTERKPKHEEKNIYNGIKSIR